MSAGRRRPRPVRRRVRGPPVSGRVRTVRTPRARERVPWPYLPILGRLRETHGRRHTTSSDIQASARAGTPWSNRPISMGRRGLVGRNIRDFRVNPRVAGPERAHLDRQGETTFRGNQRGRRGSSSFARKGGSAGLFRARGRAFQRVTPGWLPRGRPSEARSRPQLEELRAGKWVSEPGAREPPPGVRPRRLAGSRSCHRHHDRGDGPPPAARPLRRRTDGRTFGGRHPSTVAMMSQIRTRPVHIPQNPATQAKFLSQRGGASARR
jgi:hypothetical protein